jgi:hypothetical protein
MPREFNVTADKLSKLRDRCGYVLTKSWFRHIERKWGPVCIDLFASEKNFQITPFLAKYFTPTAAGVDAFSHDWSQYRLCWVHPPIDMVGRAIIHAERCKAKIVIILEKCRLVATVESNRWLDFSKGGERHAANRRWCHGMAGKFY